MTAPTVFLAVPTYNGLESQPTTMEMIVRWQKRLRARGGALSLAPLKGCSVIYRARSELVTWFLNARACFDFLPGFGMAACARSAVWARAPGKTRGRAGRTMVTALSEGGASAALPD